MGGRAWYLGSMWLVRETLGAWGPWDAQLEFKSVANSLPKTQNHTRKIKKSLPKIEIPIQKKGASVEKLHRPKKMPRFLDLHVCRSRAQNFEL